MNDNMRKFVRGLMVSTVSKGVLKKRELVAYLYNGVRLPKLPEWDREMYPYVLIAENWFWGGHPYYKMFCFPDKPSTFIDLNGSTVHGLPSGAETVVLLSYMNSDTMTAWHLKEETTSTSCRLPATIWANYDVLNEDGTLYLAASEPVPVYE